MTENINRLISSESEEDDSSDDEETEMFSLNIKIYNSENPLEFLIYLLSRK